MKRNLLILTTGFALFSMFFGSGNLVFPLTVGQENPGNFIMAALGIIITGVVVPFLGVFGMILYGGDTKAFFRYFGDKGTFLFSLAALGLMGPFGVLARCLTVVHGALQLLVPGLPLVLTSLCLCLFIFALTYNKNKIVGMLGSYLTPLLLVAIGVIAFFGVKGGSFQGDNAKSVWDAFAHGFLQGYQTMDLLAAFFFSAFIMRHLKNEDDTLKLFLKSSLIGGSLLAIIYLLLVMVGAFHAEALKSVEPKEMLGTVAMITLGPMAASLVAIAVSLACLTTAIVLTSLFADFLRYDIAQNRIGNKRSLTVTLIIAFLVSTLDFAGIAGFLGPILETIYPALIVLTFVNIFTLEKKFSLM